jgi:hypothetical protein
MRALSSIPTERSTSSRPLASANRVFGSAGKRAAVFRPFPFLAIRRIDIYALAAQHLAIILGVVAGLVAKSGPVACCLCHDGEDG